MWYFFLWWWTCWPDGIYDLRSQTERARHHGATAPTAVPAVARANYIEAKNPSHDAFVIISAMTINRSVLLRFPLLSLRVCLDEQPHACRAMCPILSGSISIFISHKIWPAGKYTKPSQHPYSAALLEMSVMRGAALYQLDPVIATTQQAFGGSGGERLHQMIGSDTEAPGSKRTRASVPQTQL